MEIRPGTIHPDTKDWTWVLQRRCPECGLDVQQLGPDAVVAALRENARDWQPVLSSASVRSRPAPEVWSPLEYACHVRDVLFLHDDRLGLMLHDDDPVFASWDQDAAATAQRYRDQDPTAVFAALTRAAQGLANRLEHLEASQWQRTGRRSDGAQFTVIALARYVIHDVTHHLHDVSWRDRGHPADSRS